MKIGAISLIIISLCGSASAERLLYGGAQHDIFLGCLECGKFIDDSICNTANMGNPHNPLSIFNQFGVFGDKQSRSSPWNRYSNDGSVPIIVDLDDNFYGYFSINKYRGNAVSYSASLENYYETANGNLSVLFTMICK